MKITIGKSDATIISMDGYVGFLIRQTHPSVDKEVVEIECLREKPPTDFDKLTIPGNIITSIAISQ